MVNVTIRVACDSDCDAIYSIHQLAFGQAAEADLVEALRKDGYLRVSLVAEAAGAIIGHIAFSELPIVAEDRIIRGVSLAPVSVLPEFQSQGIGSQLIREGVQTCRTDNTQ